MFAEALYFLRYDVSSVKLRGGLSMKYNSHSYSAKIVTALGFFF